MKRYYTFFSACFLAINLNAQNWDTLSSIPVDLTFPVVVVMDSHIHIMGGGGTAGASNAHYAYNTSTDVWTQKAAVPYLAQQPAGAVVNGKIHYLGGGYPNSGTRLNTHAVYDPSTDAWTTLDTMPLKRAIHKAEAIGDLLFVMSGQPDKQRNEAYNTMDSTWTLMSNLPDANFWYGAITEAQGTIYRFGGGGYSSPASSAHRYNPGSDNWTALPNLPNGNHAADAASIDDAIYISGGYYGFTEKDEVLKYDINNQTYTSMTPLPHPRTYHSMVSVGDCLYVLGGNNDAVDSIAYSMIRLCVYDTLVDDTTTGLQPALTDRYSISRCGDRLYCIQRPVRDAHPVFITIQDISGRIVRSFTQQYKQSAIEINVDGLPTGTYILGLESPTSRTVQRIVVE